MKTSYFASGRHTYPGPTHGLP